MKQRLLHDWNVMRVVRMCLAILFLFAAITRQEPVACLAAVYFGIQAVFNMGCCGMGCQPVRKADQASELESTVTYEEIR